MSISAYLHFDGTCREAMTFYAAALGGTDLEFYTFGGAPKGAFPGDIPGDLVMHSQFKVNDEHLMASDSRPGTFQPQTGVSVMFSAADLAGGKRIFDRLAEGGTVEHAYGPAFWTRGFGILNDRFGTRWMIAGPPK